MSACHWLGLPQACISSKACAALQDCHLVSKVFAGLQNPEVSCSADLSWKVSVAAPLLWPTAGVDFMGHGWADLIAQLDVGNSHGDLTGHKDLPAAGGLMVE